MVIRNELSPPPARSTRAAPPVAPLPFDTLLSKLRVAERASVMQHLTACRAEEDPRHADLWERLLCALLTLAPSLPRLGARGSAQFFIPDGRYKLQVFALKDNGKGEIHIYCPDVLTDGTAMGLIRHEAASGASSGGDVLCCGKMPGDSLAIEMLDGGLVSEPEAHLRPMLGWGRRVMHLKLQVTASDAQIAAVESLCAVSATHWVNA